ncbi:MAG: DEAD/DEAH box helicase [Planctomycetota bacterium]|nr:DEAD/DEAH box helicase [Planctomycetota bacterium]
MAKLLPIKDIRLDPKLLAFPYQYQAVQAVQDREYAAIFHEQGLGKTKIAIDVLLHWLEKGIVDTALLVVKKSLVRNWLRELSVHSHISPAILGQSHKANFYVFNSPARVIVTHYEVMVGEASRFRLFLKGRDVGVILDESTKIKNPDANVTRCILGLAPLFKRRLIMTGTPVANRPYDVWSQVWFLDQGKSLGNDFAGFKREVDLTADLADDGDERSRFEAELGQIYRKIAPFSVRETKNSGVIQLPEKIIKIVPAEWEPIQYDLYSQYRNDLRAVVIRDGIPSEDRAEVVLKRLLRLVQIASNPRLVDQSYVREPGKYPVLLDLVHRIRDRGQKCIIWSSFNDNVDWLAEQLRPFGSRRLHGQMAMEQRHRSIDKFLTDASTGVLVATPGAGKEGLTLTVANHVIFYDRGFSLDDYLQAQDRIHRISQKDTCYVYNLMLPESIDEWVDVLLRAKHLAAQLTQGDILIEQYRREMSYSFPEILHNILGITGSQASE